MNQAERQLWRRIHAAHPRLGEPDVAGALITMRLRGEGDSSMPHPRYAVESWFFGGSAFPADYAPIAI